MYVFIPNIIWSSVKLDGEQIAGNATMQCVKIQTYLFFGSKLVILILPILRCSMQIFNTFCAPQSSEFTNFRDEMQIYIWFDKR